MYHRIEQALAARVWLLSLAKVYPGPACVSGRTLTARLNGCSNRRSMRSGPVPSARVSSPRHLRAVLLESVSRWQTVPSAFTSGGDTMSKKRGAYRMGGNCTHARVYGYRTRQCPRCEVFLRAADFSTLGICVWCGMMCKRLLVNWQQR